MAVPAAPQRTPQTQRDDPKRTTGRSGSHAAGWVRPEISRLQRALGNRAMSRVFRSAPIQTKLTINRPDDEYEQEAERVANQVMRMPEPHPADALRRAPVGIQRRCAECEEELHQDALRAAANPRAIAHAPVHISRMCKACEKEHAAHGPPEEEAIVQAKRDGTSGLTVPDGVVRNLGAGVPLDASTRQFMEPRFGRDFGTVRVHTGGSAAASARALNALAYTVGRDVVFGSGQYSPGTGDGRRLLAHELTHVVQQQAPAPAAVQSSAVGPIADHFAASGPAVAQPKQRMPIQIARQPDVGGGQGRPTRVELIRVSCDTNLIEFETDAGRFAYNLVDCEIEDADYVATVTVTGNNVNFSAPTDRPDARASFPYRIEPGQPNPSTFFPGQTTVHIVTGRLVRPGGGSPSSGPGPSAGRGPLVCSRPLDFPWWTGLRNFRHAFINDPPANYAIRNLLSGNGVTTSCTEKTDASGPPDDPAGSDTRVKPCNPAPGQTAADVSRCLRAVYSAYPQPNLYRNLPDRDDSWHHGPNSNSFAAAMARCCANFSPSGLGILPGWNHRPAGPCVTATAAGEQPGPAGPGPPGAPPAAVPAQAATPCIQPINWTHTNPRDNGPDGIRVDIAWDSSSGRLADLSTCTVREVVNYDPIPNPPFLWNPPNPTILTVPGVDGSAIDTHSYPPGLKTGITDPREAGVATANQVYQFRCTGPGCTGTWTDFPGQTYRITREVLAEYVWTNPWRYRITKEGTGAGNTFTYSRKVEIPPP
jgi:Domain of unknown function (DUF4157)